MDNFDNKNWDALPSPAEYDKELKKIKKSLRKRNTMIVLTSLVLAAALLLGAVRYGIPALESLYWDPRTVSFGTEKGTDLDMMLAAYSDLFCPTTVITGTQALRTGFASYSVSIEYMDISKNEPVKFCYGTLEKGELFLPNGIWPNAYGDKVGALWMQDPYNNAYNKEFYTQKLSQMPEYIQVGAYITFKEDQSVQDVLNFFNKYITSNPDDLNQNTRYWMAVRHSDQMENESRCGISLTGYSDFFPEANRFYPAFNAAQGYSDLNLYEYTLQGQTAVYETHFKSLLKFMDDQLVHGTGIPAPVSPVGETDPDFYAETLAYVEKHGILVYGGYVVATPNTLVELMDNNLILNIVPVEGWVNI